ncbi:SHOCT domain-containing protein [Microbacterium sp. LRZ72]|uniref:SHOCT domain-containing protein n=1 Tax=Microbacterium sp. LRZ72 TaxID=2942481 RepID=UPI0029B040DA|nr:SHOCT domain-containing protein [Microbacterium sp. LRZ72]MDX2375744.1 SHOCT domain-containing protein [Microbacterium sp. LRZ72]
MRLLDATVEYQGYWGSFADLIWWFLTVFIFFAYLMVLFSIFGDLFRDHKLNGWWKALWIVLLVAIPVLSALVYLIARGRGMAERNVAATTAARQAQDDYIKQVAGQSPADEIAKAKALLDAGSITAEEYERIKTKALAH